MGTNQIQPPKHIVGVGASAGGLFAIRKFIGELKSLPDTAVVIIQHLSSEHQSLMDQLIKSYTQIPVKFAEPGPIEPNTIYLNSGRFNIIVKNGQFVKVERHKTDNNYYFPINLFFSSLAHEYGAHATGIILTGTGTDGSVGVVAIHEFGGMVMIQDPSSAEFDGMPEVALSLSVHDFKLSPTELGKQIQRMFSDDLKKVQRIPKNLNENATFEEIFERFVRLILIEIKQRLGINFLGYKYSTIHRRIIKHIQTSNSQDIADYYELLKINRKELEALAQGFLIRVTRFYRDAQVWESMTKNVYPTLLKNGKARPLRIFSAACSTGDEAYTLAITLLDAASKAKQNLDFKIFATDLDAGALTIANTGIFSKSALEEMPEHLIETYFEELGDHKFRVSEAVRSHILFARHDLLKDPPFIHVDLVVCRNLFIYLNHEEQSNLLGRFHFGLRPDSFLVLGRTESITTEAADLYGPVDESNRIYTNKVVVGRRVLLHKSSDVPSDSQTAIPNHSLKSNNSEYMKQDSKPTMHYGESSQFFMHYSELLLDKISKPGVVLSKDMRVLFVYGGVEDIMKVPKGMPDFSINSTITESLIPVVKDGVTTALEKQQPIQYDKVNVPERSREVGLTFIPEYSSLMNDYLVIMFLSDSSESNKAIQPAETIQGEEVEKRKIRVLEAELQKTKLTLQRTVEELETTNEELQASNEELLAANEELQSANEELQSVNEELYSVNTEMQEKMVELGNLNSDVDSMIQSTDLGVLFLDANLNIRKITPKAVDHFNLSDKDIGRNINDFSRNFVLETLMNDINKARTEVITIEHQIYNDKLKSNFILRISPYRRNVLNRQVIEGAVLAFVELKAVKK